MNRELSQPFDIKMTSGKVNQHCDLYPNGSFQKVQEDTEGNLWVCGRVDRIPEKFPNKVVDGLPETKECVTCENKFDVEHPFIESHCIRCAERTSVRIDRDEYREKLRAELIIELEQ